MNWGYRILLEKVKTCLSFLISLYLILHKVILSRLMVYQFTTQSPSFNVLVIHAFKFSRIAYYSSERRSKHFPKGYVDNIIHLSDVHTSQVLSVQDLLDLYKFWRWQQIFHWCGGFIWRKRFES